MKIDLKEIIVRELAAEDQDKRPLSISLHNRQRGVKLDWRHLESQAQRAATLIAAAHPEAFQNIPEIEVSVLSDKNIAKIHAEFLNDPTPTDVITFHHGEILLGAETIVANASEHGLRIEAEFLLCIIHGCLHLAGYLDETLEDFCQMKATQEYWLNRMWEETAE